MPDPLASSPPPIRYRPKDRMELEDGTLAPRLYIQFQCPRCYHSKIFDVYSAGVPFCLGTNLTAHARTLMIAERLVDPSDAPNERP